MDIKDFVQKFSDQFEETEPSLISEQTKYRDLDEWSSIVALCVISMVYDEYHIRVKPEEMRNTNTVEELFKLIKSYENE